MDAKAQRRAVKQSLGRRPSKLVWQTERIGGAMQFAQVPTEHWEETTDNMDDMSLAQALFDAIAASASGYVIVSVNEQHEIVIQSGVDAESKDN